MQSPVLAGHPIIAVRYLPAAKGLNVCGDWDDVVDVPDDCLSLAVGDVVGHGLEAATAMGMLRSALSAAVRALHEPARAMEVLDLYACSMEGASATTAVKAVIDTHRQHITYSIAGHPPPVLLHSLPMRIPAASWWARAMVESTPARDKSVRPWQAASAINFRYSSVSCLRLAIVFLPDPPERPGSARLITTPHRLSRAWSGSLAGGVSV